MSRKSNTQVSSTTSSQSLLIVNTAIGFGGAETRVLIEAAALTPLLQKCAVAVLRDSPLHVRAVSAGIHCHPIDTGRGDPRTALTLYKIIKKNNYSIVNGHNSHSIVWAQLAARCHRSVARISTIHSDYLNENPGIKGKLYYWLCMCLFRSGTQYITVTQNLQDELRQTAIGNNTTLIHNGISPPSVIAEKPADWPFAKNDVVIGCVARLIAVKGHRYLFEAMSLLSDLPQIKLLLVGGGKMEPILREQRDKLGLQDRVFFYGFRDDLNAIYGALDAVCLASLTEAMPFTLLEAATHGRPLIATSVGGIPTLFTDNETALLVEPKDPAKLAEKFRMLVEEPAFCQQTAGAAQQMVLDKFGMDKMIHKLMITFDRATHAVGSTGAESP
ncbi:MAG: glycosyltransferase [Granulosicoccus sp.]|nr:glycosyltransferase [Granulosicoccus sp.]